MKSTRIFSFLLGFVLTACVVLSAQDPQDRTTKNKFTSPDGVFHFEYADALVPCRRDQSQPSRWVPDDCEAFTPVCADFSARSADTIMCIAYRPNGIKDSNFEAGAFSVSELKKANAQTKCSKVEEPPPHVGKSRTEEINGTKFTVTETYGIATGNLFDGYVYRTFHRNRCYELDIRIAYANPAYADPGTMKNFDRTAVRRALTEVLNTFRFDN